MSRCFGSSPTSHPELDGWSASCFEADLNKYLVSEVRVRVQTTSPPGALWLFDTMLTFVDAAESAHEQIKLETIISLARHSPNILVVHTCLEGPSRSTITPFAATAPKLRPSRTLKSFQFQCPSESDTTKIICSVHEKIFGEETGPREILVLINPFRFVCIGVTFPENFLAVEKENLPIFGGEYMSLCVMSQVVKPLICCNLNIFPN